MPHDVFISYSSKDKNTADAICSFLEREGIRCWIAPRDISPGKKYATDILDAIKDSRVLVVVFSSNANNSEHVSAELERAMSKGIPIIPFRIEDIKPTGEMEYYLSSRHWLDALTPPVEIHIRKLVSSISLFVKADTTFTEPYVEKTFVQEIKPAVKASPVFHAKRVKLIIASLFAVLLVSGFLVLGYFSDAILNSFVNHTQQSKGKPSVNTPALQTGVDSVSEVQETVTMVVNAEEGNTSGGNPINEGRAVADDSSIYYSTGSIYKVQKSGGQPVIISTDRAMSLNIMDGWIYYININDSNKIYRMRTDGSKRAAVADDNARFLAAANGWLCYQNVSDGEKLYKIRPDGSERVKLNDDISYYINIVGDKVYYQNFIEMGRTYVIGLDGTKRAEVSKDMSDYLVVYKGWIYYSDNANGRYLCKMKFDGSEKTILDTDKSLFINAADDWIYFRNESDGGVFGGRLYKIRADGTGKQKVCDSPASNISIAGGEVYFENENKLFKVGSDNKEEPVN